MMLKRTHLQLFLLVVSNLLIFSLGLDARSSSAELNDFCSGVSVTSGESVIIAGISAPWNRIQYRPSSSSSFTLICSDDCGNPDNLTGLPNGTYVIRVEQSNTDGSAYCTKDFTVQVSNTPVVTPPVVTPPAVDYCANVVVTGGTGMVTITGVTAPWNRIQYRSGNTSIFSDICNDNCRNPEAVMGLAPGVYVFKVEQSDSDGTNSCTVEMVAEVTASAPAVDYGANVIISGGEGIINVGGVSAPRHRIQYRSVSSPIFSNVCQNDCLNPDEIRGLAGGLYVVRVEQSSADGSNASVVEVTVEVTDAGLCGQVTASGGVGEITVTGIIGSWNRIQLFGPSTNNEYLVICDDNCSDPQLISGLAAGNYSVLVEQSDGSGDYCQVTYTVSVSSGAGYRATELISFNAYPHQRAINLEWVSNTTYKNDYYVVEKSIDGEQFELLAEVENSYNSKDLTYFEGIVDANPLQGKNYYRVKQVFKNGSSQYSKVKTIDFGVDLQQIGVFPIPAQDQLYLSLGEYAGKMGTLVISNQYGQIMEQRKLENLSSDLLQIDLDDYNNGWYLIRTKVDNVEQLTERFMVSKMY